MGKLRYEQLRGRPLSFERGRHFKNTNGNNVCRGDCGVSSTEELGLDGSIPMWISLKVEVA